MTRYGWPFALLFAVFSIRPSFACHEVGKSVLLDENFKNPESGWAAAGENAAGAGISYGPSGAVFKIPSSAALNLNQHYTSDGTDLCATGIWLASGTEESTDGVAFWAKDTGNYYTAEVSRQGAVRVMRLIGKTWQVLLREGDDKHPDLIRKKSGESNEVEVQISGVKAIVWVNGKKIFEFSGQPPSGSGYVGIFTQRLDVNGDPSPTVAFTKFLIATYP